MKKMGYMGDGPLWKGIGIIKPLMAQFRSNKFKIRVGYGRQDKGKTFSEPSPKHNDPSSSTSVWVPKQKDSYTLSATDITNVNFSLSSSHFTKEPPMNTSNNEDSDDSAK